MNLKVGEAVSGLDFKEEIDMRKKRRIVEHMVMASRRLKAVCRRYMEFFDSRLDEFDEDLDLFKDLDQILACLGHRIRQFEQGYKQIGNSLAPHYGYGDPEADDEWEGTGKPWVEESKSEAAASQAL